MNQLSLEKRAQIISMLVEGSSLRAISRMTSCSINTVTKLLVDIGRACQEFHNEVMVNIPAQRVQADEIWSFVYSKQKNVPDGMEEQAGDVWTWVGIDADTKLVVSWFVGNRDAESANLFMQDIASRVATKIQLTTDGHKPYIEAVNNAFDLGGIDYAQLIKMYGISEGNQQEKRYSPAECTGVKTQRIAGKPDKKHISTSYVERQNLTMRMHMRRFTRLTNAFSKKVENHCYAIALHFVYYNFVKVHKTLGKTPAYVAGLCDYEWSIKDIVKLLDKKSN